MAALSVAALASSAATAVTASGEEGHRTASSHRSGAQFNSRLAPSVPTDPMLNGATAGMVPWVLREGVAVLTDNGTLRIELRGLVIPPPTGNSTAGPVTSVSASLYCGDSTTPAGTTPSAPLSSEGNAVFAGRIPVPSKCLAPTVLIHPNGNVGVYISASGFGG